ncbi:chromosome segregation protein SMC [Alkalicoccus halolimnae]|uniref:Chromosome partition protein Smc n=1 Tax=Alkalicoccus halolimnae TaxID=1667239 RepID=A0A5C7FQ82_9BACI|nr:chromosome segregation protein SMC [Alkalicoccus halolimnae]TXF87526.1 chromosome segregation protein SMC [Alkalicoccus halolimnae]
MFLKRLELAGFKSFADPVHVEFEDGVTAVVGPNGSGKSNISDAVRWVLGEQSARNLRGAKMEDVIFSGSEKRSPLNMAEISLILNNENSQLKIDFSEVAVTRRVFRSGDSEYLINGQQARLKDIVDLFMDSGIGKESFSIIGQGRVEEILSSKAEDRRAIFEEAAGVRKYKYRKQQSEKKLDDTEDNLSRVRDILYELESQVEPLEEQASLAKEYLVQREELKEIEAALLVFEIKNMHDSWMKEKDLVEEMENRKKRLESTLSKRETKQREGIQELKEIEGALEEYQQKLLKVSEETEKQEGLKELWKERKKHYVQNRAQYRKELETLQEKRADLDRVLEAEQDRLKEISLQVKETKKKLKETKSSLENLDENKEKKIEELKSVYIDLLNEKTSLSNEERYLQEQSEKTNQSIERQKMENAELLSSRVKEEKAFAEAENNYRVCQERVEELVKEWQDKKRRQEKRLKEFEKKETLYYEGLRHMQHLEAKIETQESMQQDYAGFFNGVKHILKERDRSFKGIDGAVAELIDVPEKLQTAVETALGASQQHVVVKDEETGRKAIQFLRERKLGRATFLPRSVVKSRLMAERDTDKIKGDPSFVGIASELVSTKETFETTVRHILGNVVIATDLREAKSLAEKLQYRYRIVTLEGDVLNPGGSMTGGSLQKKQASLISRQKELETLKSNLASLTKDTQKLEEELRSWKHKKQEVEKELEDLKTDGELERENERDAKMALEEKKLSLNALRDRLRIYDLDMQEAEQEQLKRKERRSSLSRQLKEKEAELEELNERISSLSESKVKDDSKKTSVQEQLSELQIQHAKQEEQESNINQTVHRLTKERRDLTAEIVEKDEANSLLEAELSEKTVDASSIDGELDQKRTQKKNYTEKLNKLREKKNGLQELQSSIDAEVKETSNQRQYLQEQLHEHEISINRLDVELDNRLHHLQEEYELSFEAAEKEHHLSIPAEDARAKVKLLKMGLDEIGDVNLGAIEEFERVRERFDFLKEQKDDLEEAKSTLLSIISEMDEEMTSRFKETFSEIQAHFQSVFQELFGGGKASLELTSPDDLLTTGVDIAAQPPGKKLQHLALLSGGERALTAIALLFSILRARPVPFCVLDEVEAALDEANVNRFAEFLKDFSRETQFIVVTHRKGTMETADALYGVTMQESGVSNLVSVKLAESKELVKSGSLREE